MKMPGRPKCGLIRCRKMNTITVNSNSLFMLVFSVKLTVSILAFFRIKLLLNPGFDTCEEARNEYLRMKSKNMPSLYYEDITRQYQKLCK
jgi:hypothetical protein